MVYQTLIFILTEVAYPFQSKIKNQKSKISPLPFTLSPLKSLPPARSHP